MAHWLMKSEPDSWSWEQQVLAGEAGTEWTGVRNPVARKHLKANPLPEQTDRRWTA